MCGHRRRHRDVEFIADTPKRAEPSDPEMRAGDSDRELVVTQLREHGAAGRLSVDELEERVTAALGARTFGDLRALVEDLPSLPDTRRREVRSKRRRTEALEHAAVWAKVSLLLIAIWAFTGAGEFWPAWAIFGWGFFVLMHVRGAFRGGRPRTPGPALRA